MWTIRVTSYEHHSKSEPWQLCYLFNILLRPTAKKTSKLCINGPCHLTGNWGTTLVVTGTQLMNTAMKRSEQFLKTLYFTICLILELVVIQTRYMFSSFDASELLVTLHAPLHHHHILPSDLTPGMDHFAFLVFYILGSPACGPFICCLLVRGNFLHVMAWVPFGN